MERKLLSDTVFYWERVAAVDMAISQLASDDSADCCGRIYVPELVAKAESYPNYQPR
jgi:hypothetical protein